MIHQFSINLQQNLPSQYLVKMVLNLLKLIFYWINCYVDYQFYCFFILLMILCLIVQRFYYLSNLFMTKCFIIIYYFIFVFGLCFFKYLCFNLIQASLLIRLSNYYQFLLRMKHFIFHNFHFIDNFFLYLKKIIFIFIQNLPIHIFILIILLVAIFIIEMTIYLIKFFFLTHFSLLILLSHF